MRTFAGCALLLCASLAGAAPTARDAAPWMAAGLSAPPSEIARAALPAAIPAEAVDTAIARLQLTLNQPADALAVVDAAPRAGSRVWFAIRSSALARLGRWEELRRAADAQLKLLPDDAGALRALAQADEAEERWERFDAHMRALARSGKATASDFNKLAWNALFHDGIGGAALDDARRATEMTQRRNPGDLHTLAAIEAELGNSHEAYTTLIEAIDRGTGKPRPEDFYVLGRIAESVGVPDAAIAHYRRALAQPPSVPPSKFATRALAERRLVALTAAH